MGDTPVMAGPPPLAREGGKWLPFFRIPLIRIRQNPAPGPAGTRGRGGTAGIKKGPRHRWRHGVFTPLPCAIGAAILSRGRLPP